MKSYYLCICMFVKKRGKKKNLVQFFNPLDSKIILLGGRCYIYGHCVCAIFNLRFICMC